MGFTADDRKQQAPKPTAKPAGMIRNPYVKKDAIQSSLQSLTSEADQFRKEKEKAVQEHQALLQRLQMGKDKASTLAESIRVAKDERGATHREVAMLERHERAFRDKLTKERQDLERLTKEEAAQREKDERDRRDFCDEMIRLNDKLELFLREQEKARLASLILPKTAAMILLPKSALEEVEDMMTDVQDDNAKRDVVYISSLKAVLKGLAKAAADFEQFRLMKQSYAIKIAEARSGALPSILRDPNLPTESKSETMHVYFEQLEEKWKEEWQLSRIPQTSFYSEDESSHP